MARFDSALETRTSLARLGRESLAQPNLQGPTVLNKMSNVGLILHIEHCLQLAVLRTIGLDDVWEAYLVHDGFELVDSEAKELICLVVVA